MPCIKIKQFYHPLLERYLRNAIVYIFHIFSLIREPVYVTRLMGGREGGERNENISLTLALSPS